MLLGTIRNRNYEAGIRFFDHGQYEAAIRELQKVVRTDAGSVPGESRLARFYLGEAHAALAEMELQQRAWLAAEQHLLAALEINPHYADLHYQHAKVCFETGRYDEAASRVESALEINPRFARAIYLDGLIKYLRADHEDGVRRMCEAGEIDASFRTDDLESALALHESGECDRAYMAFAGVGEIRVDVTAELVRSARDRLRAGDLGEAEVKLREALRLNPDYPDLHNLMGQIWMAKGDLLPAVHEFKASLLINPRFVAAHVNLGIACRKMGNEDAARKALKQALRIDPDNAEARELLSRR